jgi:hypothetical protein
MSKPADIVNSHVSDHRFSRPVSLQIDRTSVLVDSAGQAIDCLKTWFPDHCEASHFRATATCAAVLLGKLPPDAAQAALVVAAMAAGIPFEILDRDAAVLERQIEAAAAKGLEDAFFLAEAAE